MPLRDPCPPSKPFSICYYRSSFGVISRAESPKNAESFEQFSQESGVRVFRGANQEPSGCASPHACDYRAARFPRDPLVGLVHIGTSVLHLYLYSVLCIYVRIGMGEQRLV